MNENKVIKMSMKTYFVGLLLSIIVCIIMQSISYVIGFTIGYIISVIVFLLIIKVSALLLELKSSAIVIMTMFSLIKLIIYASGFALAVIWKDYVNIFTVFIGYLIVKVTVYIGEYKNKGGEVNE